MMNGQSPFSAIVGVDVSKDKLDFAFADGKETPSIDNSQHGLFKFEPRR